MWKSFRTFTNCCARYGSRCAGREVCSSVTPQNVAVLASGAMFGPVGRGNIMTTPAKTLPTLIAAIKDSLSAGAMIDTFEDCLLTTDRMRVRHRTENEHWDYKEAQNLSSDVSIARLARDLLGFHNAEGGVLIIGVTDEYHVAGIAAAHQRGTNELRQKLSKYVGADLPLFQDAISLRDGKILWLLFVGGRGHARPRACGADGPPLGANGQREVRAGALYQRRGDQVIACTKPEDLERLFVGYSPAELNAYSYEIDEPYLRLLAPDFEQFIGRKQIVNDILEALDLRHPIVALDGLGGAGKTATAIHVVKLVSHGKYSFIVSLSAKHRIWQNEQRSRRAAFSGLAEFLRELAAVLLVPQSGDISELEELVVEAMRGSEGLILIDNLEDIDDPDLKHFITRKVPAPVKVLLTSRIDKGWGAYTISVPQMNEEEAAELLLGEIARGGLVIDPAREQTSLKEIYRVTGCLPLALKWAAGVVVTLRSVEKAAQQLQKLTAAKREFLEFCFKTMWEALPFSATAVGMVRGFLGPKCTLRVCSLIFDDWNAGDLRRAVADLADRGLVHSGGAADTLRTMALTDDFMLKKWKDNEAFQRWALPRIAEADLYLGGALLGDTPPEDRAIAMSLNAKRLYDEGAFERAKRVIDIAVAAASTPAVRFLAGRIRYKCGELDAGIGAMLDHIDADTPPDDCAFLAEALLDRGTADDLKRAIELGVPLVSHPVIGSDVRRIVLAAATQTRNYAAVSRVLNATDDPSLALAGLRHLEYELSDTAFLTRWGIGLLPVLERTADAGASIAEQQRLKTAARMIRRVFPMSDS